MKWTSAIGYADKMAKQHYNAYDRLSLNNTHTWVLPKGQFLINAFNVNFDTYDAAEISVSGKVRHDKAFRYRVTYGTPLTTIFFGKLLPKPMKDIVFTGSYEFYRSLSNITNYSYTNNKLEMILSKRLEF
jgi:hypothetical protein